MLPKLTDYWDRRAGAIDAYSARLDALSGAERHAAIGEITAAVTEQVRVLPGDLLVHGAVAIVDDIYAGASATTRWDQGLADYLDASAGTFLRLLAEQGVIVQYLVDNAWPDMTKPLKLLRPWLNHAGLVYVCPQAIAVDLAEGDGASGDVVDLINRYRDESRHVADQLVQRCQSTRRHFMHLDTDWEKESFSAAFKMAGAPGVMTIFRNQPPDQGTEVDTWPPGGQKPDA
jgi:hypothetical protein